VVVVDQYLQEESVFQNFFLNDEAQSMLHLGNCEVVGSAPVMIFGKNTGGETRNALMGYTDSLFFVIGDYGSSNH
jgi:hypothetical protein